MLPAPPAKLLGAISYSIHLLHCLLLHAIMYSVNEHASLILMSGLAYWAIVAGFCILLVLVCSVSFRFIEYPFAWNSHQERKPSRVSRLCLHKYDGLPCAPRALSRELLWTVDNSGRLGSRRHG